MDNLNPIKPKGENGMNESRMDKILKIVERAEGQDLLVFSKVSLAMDLECIDSEIGLRLDDLLNADDFNFSHDILGIQYHLNRRTKQLENYFLPRYTEYTKEEI